MLGLRKCLDIKPWGSLRRVPEDCYWWVWSLCWAASRSGTSANEAGTYHVLAPIMRLEPIRLEFCQERGPGTWICWNKVVLVIVRSYSPTHHPLLLFYFMVLMAFPRFLHLVFTINSSLFTINPTLSLADYQCHLAHAIRTILVLFPPGLLVAPSFDMCDLSGTSVSVCMNVSEMLTRATSLPSTCR